MSARNLYGLDDLGAKFVSTALLSSMAQTLKCFSSLGELRPCSSPGDNARDIREGHAALQLTCISHHPTVEARDTTARTSLRLLAVLNVLFKYACARQAARASS